MKFVLIMMTLLLRVRASHYRGGSIKWAVSPTNPNKLMVSWRVSWRRSYEPESDFKCLEKGQELRGEGYLMCDQCSSNHRMITETKFNCTDFSDVGEATQEDWATGTGTYEYSYEISHFDIIFRFDPDTFSGSNWIQLQNYGQANFYKMVSSVDLTTRPDTNRSNSSPATTMLPVIRVQAGCTSKIRIPTLDAEGDTVRCRWAVGNECPPVNVNTVCGPITPDSLIDEDRCEITFSSAGKTEGWYGVAVMIEDFIDKNSTVALSKIPLQFLIYVYPLEMPCRQIHISSPLCEVIAPNEEFTAKLEAFSDTDGVRIVSIDTVTPLGMTRSDLTQSQDDPMKYYIDLTWTPTGVTEETVCYYATDNNGVSSNQGCFKVVVTDSLHNMDSRPEPQHNRSHPAIGEVVSPTLQDWGIYYPSIVERPLFSKKIYIKSLPNEILAEVDCSDEDQVQFTTEDGGTKLNFSTPDIELPDMQPLFIEVEEGAVIGTSHGPCAQDLGSTGARWLFRTDSSLDAPTVPTVVCDTDQMSVYIPHKYVADLPARKLMFHDPACRGDDFNETHYVIQTRFDKCGSVTKKKNGRLTVKNTVRDKIRPVDNGASVSRNKHKFEIVAKCMSAVTYNADIKLDPDSVNASLFSVQGMFDVAASMALFADDSYEDRYGSNGQTYIRLNQRLNISVKANQEDVSLKVEQCKAIAVDNQGNAEYGEFIFLDNGCPTDSTLRFEEAPATNEKRFSLDAFTFLYTGIKDYMTIKCSVSICEDAYCRQCEATDDLAENDSARGRRSIPRLTEVYLNIN